MSLMIDPPRQEAYVSGADLRKAGDSDCYDYRRSCNPPLAIARFENSGYEGLVGS